MKSGREPVALLPEVERQLQRPDPQREQSDPPVINPLRLAAEIRRIEDVQLRHQQRNDSDREVDVEHPAPAVCVGQPAADHRADDRGDDDAETPEAHGFAALVRGEGLEQDGLRQRLHRAAGCALQQPERNQEGERRRDAAQQRRDVKPPTDTISRRLRPKKVASHPVNGRTMAFATRYDVSTHVDSSIVAERLPAMCGSDTFTTVVSSTSMKVANMTAMATIHGLTVLCSAAGVISYIPSAPPTSPGGAGVPDPGPARTRSSPARAAPP